MIIKRIALTICAIFSASSLQAIAAEKADIDAGASSYAVYCASCHGSAGKGDGPMLKSLKSTPTDLTTLARANKGIFPEDKVRAVIDGRNNVQSHGTGEMPIWGDMLTFESTGGGVALDEEPEEVERLVEERINQLVGYVQTLQKNN
ncbi:MAG: c-type cytochrome [Hyphomicrobiales bacterium]